MDLVGRWLQPTVAAWAPTGILSPSTAGVGLAATLARSCGIPLYLAHLDVDGRPAGVVGEPALSDQRIVLINDVVTTGGSLASMAQLVRGGGGQVAGAAWFASRSEQDIAAIIDASTACIATALLPAWSADGCRLCQSAEPLEDTLDLN